MHVQVWKGVTKLQDWHAFPQWKPRDLARAYPDLGSDGVDLLKEMLQYQPGRRISVRIDFENILQACQRSRLLSP